MIRDVKVVITSQVLSITFPDIAHLTEDNSKPSTDVVRI